MLIVATQDRDIRAYCARAESQASAWGQVLPIDAGLTQAEAERQLQIYLGGLNAGENLCIVAHGNDQEIGDSENGGKNWGWSYKRLAALLATAVAVTPGVVLIETCGDTVSTFTARMAVRLEVSWQHIGHLSGVTLYGYSTAVGALRPIPTPAQLPKNVEAQPVLIDV